MSTSDRPVTEHDDPLAAARGCVIGTVLGAAMWAALIWAIVRWVGGT